MDQQATGGPYANEIAEALWRKSRAKISELAAVVGVSRQDMSEVVNGWRLPSAEQMDAILGFLPGWTFEQLYPNEAFRAAIEATRREAPEPA